MSPVEIVLLCALLLVAAYAAVRWCFKKDTEIENRRRAAAKLAGVLRTFGLVKTPEFLIDYSVGDYSGMAERIKRLVELFTDGEEAVVKEFKAVFERCLDAKLLTEAGRAYIAAKLSDAAKVDDVDIVHDAPLPGVIT